MKFVLEAMLLLLVGMGTDRTAPYDVRVFAFVRDFNAPK